jgi:hypothetical protein
MIRGLLEKVRMLKSQKPIASIINMHANAMGYRKEGYSMLKLGLFYDDLIPEENSIVKEALQRLTPQQQVERQFRIRRALNLNMKKIQLDSEECVTAEQVIDLLRFRMCLISSLFWRLLKQRLTLG